MMKMRNIIFAGVLILVSPITQASEAQYIFHGNYRECIDMFRYDLDMCNHRRYHRSDLEHRVLENIRSNVKKSSVVFQTTSPHFRYPQHVSSLFVHFFLSVFLFWVDRDHYYG